MSKKYPIFYDESIENVPPKVISNVGINDMLLDHVVNSFQKCAKV